ncbi:MAG: hypothetical protein NUV61_02410 [Candidatus Azambacteria bacterium]|nr:hypothetical protein [Candidatus Azambacteria bacterium]
METNSEEVAKICKAYFFQFLDNGAYCNWHVRSHLMVESDFSAIGNKLAIGTGRGIHIYPGTPAVLFEKTGDTKNIFVPPSTFICRDANAIDIFGYDAKELALRTYTSARAIMEEFFFSSGFSMIHASCVNINGKGVIFTGDKGAGKTTFLLFLLESGATFVGNDRLFVRFNGTDTNIIPRPSLTRIGMGSALNTPRLSGIVPEKYRDLDYDRLVAIGEKLEFPNFPMLFDYSYTNIAALKYAVSCSLSKTQSLIRERDCRWDVRLLQKNRLEDFPGLLTWKHLFGGNLIPPLLIDEENTRDIKCLELLGPPSNELLRYF